MFKYRYAYLSMFQVDSRWTLENHLESSGVHLNSVGECKVLPDHENYLEAHGSHKQVYLNNAKYLKAGQNLYVDWICSNAIVNGTYSFHASTAAYAEFWTNTYGKQHSFKITRHQIWHIFIQESVYTIAKASNIILETQDNPSIADLTYDAFAILGE